jgi:RHS repeat-associated protein
MRSANLFFFTQPQETFEDWYQVQQNTPFEEKEEQFFAEFQQQPVSYGSVIDTSYQDSLYWKEQHLYGSSRLGIAKHELEVTNYNPSNASKLTTNFRNYEITNHLGNVLSTIKDEKQQIDQNADGIVDYYEPIVITANDYYPFGMVMPNRSFSLAGSGYRFGFNGQLRDDEVYGKGNLNSALFWEYDTRLGRRWNVDPKPNPSMSVYSTFNNNPIWYADPLGDTTRLSFDGKTKKLTIWGNTPENPTYIKVGEYDAHNKITKSSQGKWEDGNYSMRDKEDPNMHGNQVDINGVKKDTRKGMYGVNGAYVSNSFTQTDGKRRVGMAIHAGRANSAGQVGSKTLGCIRVSENTMEEIGSAIDKYGSLESVTILNNKTRQDNATISQPYLNQGRTVFFIQTVRNIPAVDNTYVKPPIILPLNK